MKKIINAVLVLSIMFVGFVFGELFTNIEATAATLPANTTVDTGVDTSDFINPANDIVRILGATVVDVNENYTIFDDEDGDRWVSYDHYVGVSEGDFVYLMLFHNGTLDTSDDIISEVMKPCETVLY